MEPLRTGVAPFPGAHPLGGYSESYVLLGLTSNTSIPIGERYVYEPLPSGGEYIRLLETTSGQVETLYSLRIFPLSECFGNYEALSYVWGNPYDRANTRIDGKILSITINLYALRALASEGETRRLWIDALLTKYGRPFNIPNPIAENPICADRKKWDLVQELTKLPWFSRVWVLQEAGYLFVMPLNNLFRISDTFYDLWKTFTAPSAYWRSTISKGLVQSPPDDCPPVTLAEILHIGRRFKATDLRDYIFAFLGHPTAIDHHPPVVEDIWRGLEPHDDGSEGRYNDEEKIDAFSVTLTADAIQLKDSSGGTMDQLRRSFKAHCAKVGCAMVPGLDLECSEAESWIFERNFW